MRYCLVSYVISLYFIRTIVIMNELAAILNGADIIYIVEITSHSGCKEAQTRAVWAAGSYVTRKSKSRRHQAQIISDIQEIKSNVVYLLPNQKLQVPEIKFSQITQGRYHTTIAAHLNHVGLTVSREATQKHSRKRNVEF